MAKPHALLGTLAIGIVSPCAVSCGLVVDPGDHYLATNGGAASTSEAMNGYAEIVLATYQDSLATAVELQSTVDAFVANPTAYKLEEARAAWLDAREPYMQTQVYRVCDSPADFEWPPINPWPVQESLIDYVDGAPDAGLVNNPSITIDDDELLNGRQDISELRHWPLGFHAIEFLLWGQDRGETAPGDRPYTDYVAGAGATAANPERRADYLSTAAALLVESLESLVSTWEEGNPSNYRALFSSATPEDQARQALSCTGALSGILMVPWLQRMLEVGEEEEESRFSDNTHRDLLLMHQGLTNVSYGTYILYARPDEQMEWGGVAPNSHQAHPKEGLYHLVARRDVALANAAATEMNLTGELLRTFEPPFEREIMPDNPVGRARVEALLVRLLEEQRLFQAIGALFELGTFPGLCVPPDEGGAIPEGCRPLTQQR